MYYDDFMKVSESAKIKINFMKKYFIGFFISSIMAGIYIGIAVIFVNTIGCMFQLNVSKIVTGLGFSLGLNLVVVAGAELFTGNIFIVTVGILERTVKLIDGIRLLFICYFGNLFGSIIVSLMFFLSGGLNNNVTEFMNNSSLLKISLSNNEIFFKAIFCNMLVCFAVWSIFRCKSETSKFIMIFLCIFAFVVSGFEHCIANMTLIFSSIISPFSENISIIGFLNNILYSTLGNILGGSLFVALPYYIICKYRK